MNIDELQRLFDRLRSVEADDVTNSDANSDAKARARMAALDAFDASDQTVHRDSANAAKDSAGVVRPMVDPDKRSKTMGTTMTMKTQRWMVSGLASAAVMVLAVVFVLQLPSMNVPDESAPFLEETVDFSKQRAEERTLSLPEQAPLEVQTKDRKPLSRPAPNAMPDATTVPAPAAVARERPVMNAADQLAVSGARYSIAPAPETTRDSFPRIEDNNVRLVREAPVSTFSIDVDTASYSFVRKQLEHGRMPAADAVRLEEMVNYFPFEYPQPTSREVPFEPTVSVMDSPWNEGNKIVHIGIRGFEAPADADIRSNLVFLLDVSGSMNRPDKLPLVKQSIKLLLDQLGPEDTVALVVYAGGAGVVLEPTPVAEKRSVIAAIDNLSAGGSTAGAAGIRLAYETALSAFVEQGVNRVILATDGDFNVGISDPDQLTDFIEDQRDQGVFLSVLGFGQGNYQDSTMQALAQNGNGIAAYIDGLAEAQKVLVNQATSTLLAIAKDVKIQVEFNPATVKEYRLLGYETRSLNREDFNNDAVDAGEIGAGHTVTALYEITPVGQAGLIDPLRYGDEGGGEGGGEGPRASEPSAGQQAEYGFLKMRYKLPDEKTSKLITRPIGVGQQSLDSSQQREAMFALAVAGFAQLLRNSDDVGEFDYDDVVSLAQPNRGTDEFGYRAEFVQLVRTASLIDAQE